MKIKTVYIYIALFAIVLIAIVIYDSQSTETVKPEKIPTDINKSEMPKDAIHQGLENPTAEQPSSANVLESVKQKMKKLEEEIQNNPDDTVRIREYANFLFAAHRPDKALKYYKKILDKNPDRIDILLSVTSIYFNKGDYKKAEETTRRILSVDNDNLEATYNLGVIYAVTGRKNKAKEIWEEVVKNYPGTEVAGMAKSALQKL